MEKRHETCEHGRPTGCGLVHTDAGPPVGWHLCPDCYDYTGHVLWHAHAGHLWKAFTDNLYHHLAARTGQSRTALRRTVRISYAKVAEYQRRAAVHVHAVMRLDGAGGADEPSPAWADALTLADAVRTAAAAVRLSTSHHPAFGEHELRWGTQLDVRPLRASTGPDAVSDDAVAAYVAKYVTKGAADTGTSLDHAVASAAEITTARVSEHFRTLMLTCRRLGSLPELAPLRLRPWAHTLGYRGHILTKSRAYSTTYAELRSERAAHQGVDVAADDANKAVDAAWRYVALGHTARAALIVTGIAEDLAIQREVSRQERETA